MSALIVVGIDGSDTSWDAFCWACGETNRLGGRTVAVFVGPTFGAASATASASFTGTVVPYVAIQQSMTDQAEKLSEQVRAYGQDHCVHVAFVHTQGDTESSYGLPTPITPISWSWGPPPRPAIVSLVHWVDGLSVDAGHRSSSWFRDVKGRHDERDIVRACQRKRGMRIKTKGGKMFDGNGFTLRLRRFRRSTVCIARNPTKRYGFRNSTACSVELQLWASGMPWVAESPSGARERLKLFVLDCAPLSCHEPWFAISAVDDDTDDVPGVVVVLSDAFSPESDIDRRRSGNRTRSGGSARSP